MGKSKVKKKKKFWTSNKILSLSAIFMSACTLIVLIYQTNLMRKQQYMSEFPYLELGNYGGGTPNFRFSLTNNGVGPALIKSVKIQNKGKVYEEDLEAYLSRTIQPKDSLYFYYSNLGKGQLIPPNHTVDLISLYNGTSNDAHKLAQFIHDEEVDLEIEYASIYGERWVFSNHRPIPKKLD